MFSECRACLRANGNMRFLFEDTPENKQLISMFMSVTCCEWINNNHVAPFLCQECESALQFSYKFQKKCQEIHEIMKKILQDDPLQTEVTELGDQNYPLLEHLKTEETEFDEQNYDSLEVNHLKIEEILTSEQNYDSSSNIKTEIVDDKITQSVVEKISEETVQDEHIVITPDSELRTPTGPPTKKCFVPTCDNTSDNSSKIFLSVPSDTSRRQRWFQAVGYKFKSCVTKSKSRYCCEDHFSLKKDSKNWCYFKLMGDRVLLKPNVVPHRHIKRPFHDKSYSQLNETAKKIKADNLKKLKQERKKFETPVNNSNTQPTHIYLIQIET